METLDRYVLCAIVFVIVVVTAGSGVAHATAEPGQLDFQPAVIDPATVVAKVDDFVLVVDGSLSMAGIEGDGRKVDVARELAAALARTAPAVDYRGGVRSFGQGPCLPDGATSRIFGVEPYWPEAAALAAERVTCTGGPSPLDEALAAVASDLDPAATRAAVIIVSDGRHMDGRATAAAQALKDTWGEGLCLYPVVVGDDGEGQALMQRLAAIGGCGDAIPAAELAEPGALETFVRDALLWPDEDGDGVPDHLDACPGTPRGTPVDERGCSADTDGDGVPDGVDECPGTPAGAPVDDRGCPLDSDGDGVPDYRDQCPETPAGTAVDSLGCPLDTDRDGVPDNVDRCPGTPPNTPVNDDGCPIRGVSVESGAWRVQGEVLFDFNRAEIRADAQPVLDGLAAHLQRNPDLRLVIEGHTDAIGSESYNLKLSKKRADAAKAYLVSKGVDLGRLWTTGAGMAHPVAPNDTAAGRALNRRVEFIPQS
jgi:OOP family OmpA-OmpF porin